MSSSSVSSGIEMTLLKKGSDWTNFDEVETGVFCFNGCLMSKSVCYALGLDEAKEYVLFVNAQESRFSVCNPVDGKEIGSGRLQVAPAEMKAAK